MRLPDREAARHGPPDIATRESVRIRRDYRLAGALKRLELGPHAETGWWNSVERSRADFLPNEIVPSEEPQLQRSELVWVQRRKVRAIPPQRWLSDLQAVNSG
jgi:hypothetical protein